MPPPPETFGSRLQVYFWYSPTVTIEELAEKAEIPLDELQEYLNSTVWNDKKPPMRVAERILDALGVQGEDRDYWLSLAVINNLEARQLNEARLRREYEENGFQARKSLDIISSSVQDIADSSTEPAIREAAQEMVGEVASLKANYARIGMPKAESLDIHMVPITDVQRLDEFRSDQNLALVATTSFFGIAAGIGVNLLTGGVLTAFACAIGITSAFATLFMGVLSFIFYKRADDLRRKFIAERQESASS